MTRYLYLRPRAISRMGITFRYKGTDVIRLWRGGWLSYWMADIYESLEAIDIEWDAYFAACITVREGEWYHLT